jgi:hypothetical protein
MGDMVVNGRVRKQSGKEVKEDCNEKEEDGKMEWDERMLGEWKEQETEAKLLQRIGQKRDNIRK